MIILPMHMLHFTLRTMDYSDCGIKRERELSRGMGTVSFRLRCFRVNTWVKQECQFFYKLFEIDDLPPRGSDELERTLGLLNTEDYVLDMRMLILPGPLYFRPDY